MGYHIVSCTSHSIIVSLRQIAFLPQTSHDQCLENLLFPQIITKLNGNTHITSAYSSDVENTSVASMAV